MSDELCFSDEAGEEDELRVFENSSHSLIAIGEMENMRQTGELIDCTLKVLYNLPWEIIITFLLIVDLHCTIR